MLDKRAAARASANLSEYSHEKGIYMKINYFDEDHTHALIDIPTNLSIEQVIQLLKGRLFPLDQSEPFGQRQIRLGQGLRSLLGLAVGRWQSCNYIARQEEHHRKRSFAQEYEIFVKRYGLEWRGEQNR